MAREMCEHLAFPRSVRLQLYREPPLPVVIYTILYVPSALTIEMENTVFCSHRVYSIKLYHVISYILLYQVMLYHISYQVILYYIILLLHYIYIIYYIIFI